MRAIVASPHLRYVTAIVPSDWRDTNPNSAVLLENSMKAAV
jgi:hypothetical protein